MKASPLFSFFIQHRTAANLIMFLMLAVGIVALGNLNRQFFPSFDVEVIGINVNWRGATAEDIDTNIVQPLEPELRTIANVKKVTSNSYEGLGQVEVEFAFGTDMQKALADVESAVAQVDFPEESETPKIIKYEFYDTISKLVISGPFDLAALRDTAKDIKEDLQRLGVDKIVITGLPDAIINIEISQHELARLGLSLTTISQALSQATQDTPAGRLADGALRVRSLGQIKTAKEYEEIEVQIRADGSRTTLGDIATISEDVLTPATLLTRKGYPAVQLTFQRGRANDSLAINEVVQDWLAEYRTRAPQALVIEQYDVRAVLISERINLLVTNGAGGLLLVIGVLFLFLSMRVAFWVAAGIPVAFLATFGVMLALDQTINMISLFGLIMALGIVVDDAIVIGEHAEYLRQHRGLPMADAAALSATRMGPPVICAMLTTVAAFLPLFLVKGIIGVIIAAIPMVVVAVLIASLVEVFFVLPAHLAHFGGTGEAKNSGFRYHFDRGFDAFKNGAFRRLVEIAVNWRYATLALSVAMLMLTFGMLAGGRVGFVFFTSPEADIAYGNITMAPGTSRSQTEAMLKIVEDAAVRAEAELTEGKGGLIRIQLGMVGANASDEPASADNATDILAGVIVELLTADQRDVRIDDFLRAWEEGVTPIAGLERLTIRAPRGGPPGRDMDVRLMGDDLEVLKSAGAEVELLLKAVPAASGVAENLSYGAEERIIRITPYGQSLNLTAAEIGNQLRAALEGAEAGRFPRGDEEVTVKISLPDDETLTDNIGEVLIITPNGRYVPLKEVARVENRLGFSVVRRQDGFREIAIQGDLDTRIISTPEALAIVESEGLKDIAENYNLRYRFDGRDQEQAEAFGDMGTGAVLALLCIYVILSWVFSSWALPLAVMAMIPFALIGAVLGHYIMGLTMTILSMFALIALAGIVVNNSIILVATIERRLEESEGDRIKAIINGTIDRLRPVFLTSVTTICGLSTLMFERSLQAQFLIPMATTIVFGLAITTLLVLFVVPSMLAIGIDLNQAIRGALGRIALLRRRT